MKRQTCRPKVVVLSLGGTIASTNKSGGSGVKPSLSGEELVKKVRGLKEIADVETISFRLKPSADLTFSDLASASTKIAQILDTDIDGVVVTQGTDTIEETSFFFDLVINSNKPVVVTGSMRNPASVSPDGDLNLLEAVLVASSPKSRELGTLVVMNSEIHLAPFVQKTNTQNVSTFKSPSLGPIGWISEGKVRLMLRPAYKRMYLPSSNGKEPVIPIVKSVLGDDGIVLKALRKVGIQGLVIEATGGGHVSSPVADFVQEYGKSIPIILCSRTGSGEVLTQTYSFKGSEIDLINKGAIPAGIFNSLKARILLYLLLKNEYCLLQIREKFQRWL
jgi:L-asparaginase